MQARGLLKRPALMKARLASLVLLAAAAPAWAFQIDLDYTYDVANGDFFGQHPVAKHALQAAANDINALIASQLGAVTQSQFVGTSGPATVTLKLKGSFTEPSTGADVVLDPVSLAADHVTIYVGMRKLADSTLGTGGPGAASLGTLTSGGTITQQSAAYRNAQDAAKAVYQRGAGPVIGRLVGAYNANTQVDLPYGALVGNLWFDNDTDDNNVVDDFSLLDAYWHFDATTMPLATQNDFYSVALHELLHSIGLGTSETWHLQANGTTWSGAHARALNGGSGLNLVENGHIDRDIMSVRLFDSAMQEPVMTPFITTGTRKYLTAMDAAFLMDLNYIIIPEPASFALLIMGAGVALGTRRRRPRGTTACPRCS